jgi:hypothetical protein
MKTSKKSDVRLPKTARCRWCEKNKSFKYMAIFSYKAAFGMFTGVCKKCTTGPGAEQREAAYLARGPLPARKKEAKTL